MTQLQRHSRDDLLTTAKRLTDRDRAIVATLASVRLATAEHIRQLHFATGSPISTGRDCRRVLNRLIGLGVVSVLDQGQRRSNGGRWPHYYRLGSVGQRLVWPERRRYPQILPMGSQFRAHILALTDLYVAIHVAASSGAVEIRRCQTEPRCWRRTSALRSGTLKPDMYLLLGRQRVIQATFIEMDMATEPPVRIRAKLNQYYDYWASGREQERTKLFPRVLFLVPNQTRLTQIQQIISDQPKYMQALFTAALQADAIPTLIGGL